MRTNTEMSQMDSVFLLCVVLYRDEEFIIKYKKGLVKSWLF